MIVSRISTTALRGLPRVARAASGSARPTQTQAGSLVALGTRDIFDKDHDAFRESVRTFYDERVKPNHGKWEEDGAVPRDLWLEAGEHGMLGVTMPEQHGGMGLDILFSAITWEEQGYSGCTGPGFSLHSCAAPQSGPAPRAPADPRRRRAGRSCSRTC